MAWIWNTKTIRSSLLMAWSMQNRDVVKNITAGTIEVDERRCYIIAVTYDRKRRRCEICQMHILSMIERNNHDQTLIARQS